MVTNDPWCITNINIFNRIKILILLNFLCSQSDVAMTDLIQALWKENHPTESYEENRSGEWIGRKHHYQPHPDTSLSAGYVSSLIIGHAR